MVSYSFQRAIKLNDEVVMTNKTKNTNQILIKI